METNKDDLQSLVLELFAAEGIKFEDVMLKTGHMSPIYIDLRVVVSHPALLKKLGGLLSLKIKELTSVKFDSICGVPYTALPIATAASLLHDVPLPMLMRRKEAKRHGTRKTIEGAFDEGDAVLVLEDVITSGTSILETVTSLRENKLLVTDALVVLDRNQDGVENLKNVGINVHCLLDLHYVTSVLEREKQIAPETASRVNSWLKSNPSKLSAFSLDQFKIAGPQRKRLPFQERSSTASNKLTSQIFEVISRKSSNLCVAADFATTDQVLLVADCVGPHIAILKLHADVLIDFSAEFVHDLQLLAQKHDFVICEDRKFADIGNTVRQQYAAGIQRIASWAQLVTCHVTPGAGVVQGLRAGLPDNSDMRGCVLVAEMSSAGNMLGKDAVELACSVAEQNPDFVVGFIAQSAITCNPSLIHMTPGVSFETGSDALGQQYLSPEQAIANGADVVIVGRAVTAAGDTEAQVAAAIQMKERAFQAYLLHC